MGVESESGMNELIDSKLVQVNFTDPQETVWELNNTSYFVFDGVKYQAKACSSNMRKLKKWFNDFIRDTLGGKTKILGFYYQGECDETVIEDKNTRLCFNAYNNILCMPECYENKPDNKYEQLCDLWKMSGCITSARELYKIGFILCDLIPLTQGKCKKTYYQLENEKSMIWDMIIIFADNHNITFGDYEDQLYKIANLLNLNRVYNYMLMCNAKQKSPQKLQKYQDLQLSVHALFETWSEELEWVWKDIKEEMK